jgi:hypothetical protein
MRLKVPFLGYLLAFFGLLLPSAILVALLPSLIDAQTARERLIAQLTEWTGGRVDAIETAFTDSYFEMSVVLKDVTITQLTTLPTVSSIRAQEIEARVSSLDLIFGKLNYKKIKISGATINVDAGNPREATFSILAMLSGPRENPFDAFVLRDSVVVMREEPGKPSRSVHVDSAHATVEKPSGAVAVAGSLEWDSEILNFTVARGPTAPQEARVPLMLQLDGRLFAAKFDGEAVLSANWQAAGSVSLETVDATRFYAWLGFGARPVATDSLAIMGTLDATPERVNLQPAEFSLGGQAAVGTLTAKLTGAAPRLEGKLVFGNLDLDRLVDYEKGAVRLLPLADTSDVDFRVSADSLKWQGVRTGNAAFTVSAQLQQLTVEIAELDFMDGALRGQLEVDPAEKPLRVRTRLIANGMNVTSLLALWQPGASLSGKADADISADLRWADGKILDASTGHARLSFPDGGRIGLNFLSLADSVTTGSIDGWGAANVGSTSFDDMRLVLALENGRVRWDNLELKAGSELVTGAGSVHLSQGIVDAQLVVIPERTERGEDEDTAAATSPAEHRIGLSITGAWLHPLIRAEMSQTGELPNGQAKAAVLEVPHP